MFKGLFKKKHKSKLSEFIELNNNLSLVKEENFEYINIMKSAKLFEISSLLEVLRNEKMEIAFHDTIHPTISDPGAYFSYSTIKAPNSNTWSMTYGNHGWSGGIYHIKNETLSKQIHNLIQNDKIDKIQITGVIFFNKMDVKSEIDSYKKDLEISSMHDMKNIPTYKLRFFFDYGCGGCLWCDNEAAYEKYDVGTIDADTYDLNGVIIEHSKIKLPESTRQKVLELDKLYSESLNWEDPTEKSLWNKSEWESFHIKTRELHKEISTILGDDFEIIYKQE